MRRVSLARAGLTAVALSAISFVAAPASAGGPTSVLLSVPGAGSTASLYYTDPEYDELADLVGVTDPSGTSADNASGGGHEFGAGVTVTWLIHDVEPWRVDRIYLGGKDGPWISTQVSNGAGSLWDSRVVWHRPADPARLAELLGRLGMNSEAARDPGFDGVAGAPVEAAAPDQDEPEQNEPAENATAAGSDAVWWALAGVAAGALMTAAWTRHRRRTGAESAAQSPGIHDFDAHADVVTR
jgi:hypothetical protein